MGGDARRELGVGECCSGGGVLLGESSFATGEEQMLDAYD